MSDKAGPILELVASQTEAIPLWDAYLNTRENTVFQKIRAIG